MAEPKTIFDDADDADDADEALEAAAVAEARSEIAAGKGLSHAVVVERLRRLAAGDIVPPPLLD